MAVIDTVSQIITWPGKTRYGNAGLPL